MKMFLEVGLAMMETQATKDHLRDPDIKFPGDELKEMQRKGWDPLGFDKNLGCQALESIDEQADTEIGSLKARFLLTSMRVYLQALEERKPAHLENSKKIPKDTLVEFFNSCNVLMQLPEFQEQVAKYVMEHGSHAGPLIIESQRKQLEILGFEADHGCTQLSNILEDYPKDTELHAKFRQWAAVATNIGNTVASEVMKSKMDPEVVTAIEKARHAVEKLSPEERQNIVEKMQQRVDVLQKLAPKDQQEYMSKQTPDMRHDYYTAQVIMMNAKVHQMRNQAMQQQAMKAEGGSGIMATVPDGKPAEKPSQQKMM